MRLGIMQPYFLPYLGYFQLMTSTDRFVYYDDVAYIKQGWINRNNMLLNGQSHLFTLELKGASSFKKINDIEVGGNRMKLLKTFQQAYIKYPYFKDVEPLLVRIFECKLTNLFNYILETHLDIFHYLSIDVNYLVSSAINKDDNLKGKDKVIDICKNLGATSYVNAIGGQHLYSKDDFRKENIELYFLKSGNIPRLSIIDVMMNYPPEYIRNMLNDYELI